MRVFDGLGGFRYDPCASDGRAGLATARAYTPRTRPRRRLNDWCVGHGMRPAGPDSPRSRRPVHLGTTASDSGDDVRTLMCEPLLTRRVSRMDSGSATTCGGPADVEPPGEAFDRTRKRRVRELFSVFHESGGSWLIDDRRLAMKRADPTCGAAAGVTIDRPGDRPASRESRAPRRWACSATRDRCVPAVRPAGPW